MICFFIAVRGWRCIIQILKYIVILLKKIIILKLQQLLYVMRSNTTKFKSLNVVKNIGQNGIME